MTQATPTPDTAPRTLTRADLERCLPTHLAGVLAGIDHDLTEAAQQTAAAVEQLARFIDAHAAATRRSVALADHLATTMRLDPDEVYEAICGWHGAADTVIAAVEEAWPGAFVDREPDRWALALHRTAAALAASASASGHPAAGGDIVDEVRCRRLVVVDDTGTERIIAAAGDRDASIEVHSTRGSGDGKATYVAIGTNEENVHPMAGVWGMVAGNTAFGLEAIDHEHPTAGVDPGKGGVAVLTLDNGDVHRLLTATSDTVHDIGD